VWELEGNMPIERPDELLAPTFTLTDMREADAARVDEPKALLKIAIGASFMTGGLLELVVGLRRT
jgi:hypothetical protein